MITGRFAVSAFLTFSTSMVSAGAAGAQARANSTVMACNQARAFLSSSGAAILSTGPGTYDRYVRGEGFCAREEMAVPAWVRTRDVAQCFVGYTCESRTGRDPR